MKLFNMKLKTHHLFYILLGALVLSHLGFGVREYFDGNEGLTMGTQKEMRKENREIRRGIRREDIPVGDEDLYIKKTEIVPPVCPKCPDITSCPKIAKCPPCPPCGRCPEPAFECKKVPNYKRKDDDMLPRPVLADFSQFGM